MIGPMSAASGHRCAGRTGGRALSLLTGLIVGFVAGGCPSATRPASDAAPYDPAVEELRQDLSAFCTAVGPVACRVPFACCAPGERGYFDQVATEAHCPAFLEPSCLLEVEEVVADRGAAVYDPVQAEQTLARLAAAERSCDISPMGLLRALSPRSVLRGTAPRGTECTLISELPFCADACLGDDENGYECGAGARVGETCFAATSGIYYGCATGLVCVYVGGDLTCSELLGNGARCSWDYQCRSDRCWGGTCTDSEICVADP